MNLLNLSDCIYGEFVHTPDMDSRRARQPQGRTRAADVPRCGGQPLPWDYFRFARQDQFPRLGQQIFAELTVGLFFHEAESRFLVNMTSCRENALSPEGDLFIAD